MARNYWIVDCISGYHDEEDEPIKSIAEARRIRDELNAERKAAGASEDFWVIIDSKGNTVV